MGLIYEYNNPGKVEQARIDYQKRTKELRSQYDEAKKLADAKLKEAKDAVKKAKNAVPQDQAALKAAEENLVTAEQAHKNAVNDALSTRNSGLDQANQMYNNIRDENRKLTGFGQFAKEVKDEAAEGAAQSLKNARPSESFYRDVVASVQGRPTGNTFDAAADQYQSLAQDYQNDAANRDKEAQRANQEGTRNKFQAAGEISSEKNEEQNRADIQSNAAQNRGTRQGMIRNNNAMDVEGYQQYAAEQRNVANKQAMEADEMRQEATGAFGQAENFRIQSRDFDRGINENDRLTQGVGPQDQEDPGEKKDETTNETQTTEETQTESEPEPKNNPTEIPGGSLQNIVNLGANSTVRRTVDPNNPNNWKGWRVQNGKVTPDPKLDKGDTSNCPEYTMDMETQLQAVLQAHPEYLQKEGESNAAWTARVNNEIGRGGNLGDKGSQFNQNQGRIVQGQSDDISDSRMKNIESCNFIQGLQRELSDMRMKWIKEDYDKYGKPIDKDDLIFLLMNAGKFKHGDQEYDYDNADSNDESVVNAYADHIKNYVYTYKPEATQIDSSIDPNEEHIGPMAQDIEQVNPACVKETPEGVKTVDTGRLAMMNAGAIADLARQMQELTNKLKALGV